MKHKKIFFILLIFILLFSNVNAIVVSDISSQIEQGNQKIMENNAQITSEVSQLKEQLARLQQDYSLLNESVLKRENIPELVFSMEIALNGFLQNLLIMLLVLVIFSFAGIFYAKSKGWL